MLDMFDIDCFRCIMLSSHITAVCWRKIKPVASSSSVEATIWAKSSKTNLSCSLTLFPQVCYAGFL